MKTHIIYILLFVILFIIMDKRKKIIVSDINQIEKTVKNLNRGGCGVFAYNLYSRLDTNRYELKIIENGQHIMVFDKLNKYFLDSGGIHDSLWVGLNYGKRIDTITADSLLKLINNPTIWNNAYNRNQDSIIMQYIDKL